MLVMTKCTNYAYQDKSPQIKSTSAYFDKMAPMLIMAKAK